MNPEAQVEKIASLMMSSSSNFQAQLSSIHQHEPSLETDRFFQHHHLEQETQLLHQHFHNSAASTSTLHSTAAPQAAIMSSSLENDASEQLPLTRLTLGYVYEPMQRIEQQLDYYFNHFWTTNGDQRSNQLPFMSSGPWKLLYATLVYLYLIKWLLPKIMSRQRRPLELDWCIRFYNLLMVLSNMYAFYHGIRILEFGSKCFGCEVINHQDYSPKAMELLHYGWLFLMSRLVEWLDTIFFILRKKEKQATKLHIFHHSFVPMICWVYLKFHPGYTVAFFPLVNTFVHTIMYTYYLLATFGPKVQPYLWWKKYLTSLQIAQFVLILIQLASIPLSSNEKCQYPRGFLYVAFAGAILFLWLFYTYYLDTYKSTKSSQLNSASTSAKHLASIWRKHDSNLHNGQTKHFKPAREGTSKALSEVIDNAIGVESHGIPTMRKKYV